jgi:hypothetical protein
VVTFEELTGVDEKMKNLDSEEVELIRDMLPRATRPREKPYTHIADIQDEVLNICPECWNTAKIANEK